MILEDATKEAFGHHSWELPPQSNKPIFAACELCGDFKVTTKNRYKTFCHSCSMIFGEKMKGKNHPLFGIQHTKEEKAKMSAAKTGENNPFFNKTHTEETKSLISKNHADVSGEKNPMFGRTGDKHPMFDKHHTKEAKALISAAQQGEKNHNFGRTGDKSPMFGKKYTEEEKAKMSAALKGKMAGEKNPNFGKKGEEAPNWQGGISFEPYCIKFNDEYKEHIRNLFGNECFLCGMSEEDNGQALSVHHKDYNKECGCDGTVCKCVPLCIKCHSKTGANRDYWQALITEMLQPVEAWI